MAKNFLGYLKGKYNQACKEKAVITKYELSFVLDDLIKKYYEFEGNDKVELTLEGWKGKDKLDIRKDFNNDFIIVSHIKDKESGEVDEVRTEVLKEHVNFILGLIRLKKIGESVSCYDFAEPLGFKDWKDLWRERKVYFTRYYNPVKVLECLKIISYSGRGKITRLI